MGKTNLSRKKKNIPQPWRNRYCKCTAWLHPKCPRWSHTVPSNSEASQTQLEWKHQWLPESLWFSTRPCQWEIRTVKQEQSAGVWWAACPCPCQCPHFESPGTKKKFNNKLLRVGVEKSHFFAQPIQLHQNRLKWRMALITCNKPWTVRRSFPTPTRDKIETQLSDKLKRYRRAG